MSVTWRKSNWQRWLQSNRVLNVRDEHMIKRIFCHVLIREWSTMKVIVGLGNPGDKYKDTRHNVGFDVLDKLAHELGSTELHWEFSKKHNAMTANVGEVVLVKPQTYMNDSGAAVASLVAFYKLTPADVWVIHDDLDLPMGKIRIRTGGGSAGHHGIDSVIQALKSDTFLRFRLGIGRGNEVKERRHVIDFVLSKFSRGEAGDLKHLVKRAAEAVRISLFDGTDRAMNRFN